MANEPSTTELLGIRELRDDIIIAADGSLRAVVSMSAVNFDLRSSDEQAALLQQFQAFLNALDFPVQIVVHSRRYDIAAYLASVRTTAETITNELLKMQAEEYGRFVSELSDLANIMTKRFSVVIPFSVPVVVSSNGGFLKSISGLFRKKKPKAPLGADQQGLPADPADVPDEHFTNARRELLQRAETITGGLSGMGLQGTILTNNALVALFTDLYHPRIPTATHHA